MSAWGMGNIGGGVGGLIAGMIVVTYPSGSTVTISGPNVTRKDLSTTKLVYYIKELSTYTITSTKSTQSTTQTVSMTYFGQTAILTMTYQLDIIKNGVVQSGYSFTSSSKAYDSTYSSATGSSNTFTAGSGSTAYAVWKCKYNSSYHSGFLLKTGNIAVSKISSYSTLVIVLKRFIYTSSGSNILDLGTFYGSSENSSSDFKNHTKYTNTANDTSWQTVNISLTTATKNLTNFNIAFAMGITRLSSPTEPYIHIQNIYFK